MGGWRRAAEVVIFLVALTIVAGGFVAGLHAGLTYNTFPLMDGSFVPAGYAQLQPFVLNWFENVAAVQFNHRLLADDHGGLPSLLLWLAGQRAALPRPARSRAARAARRGRAAIRARGRDPAAGRAGAARRRASGRGGPAADRRDRVPPQPAAARIGRARRAVHIIAIGD